MATDVSKLLLGYIFLNGMCFVWFDWTETNCQNVVIPNRIISECSI